MSSFTIDNIYYIIGRQAVVTGGGSGTGQMICQGFAANGVNVAVVDLLQYRLDGTLRLCEQIKNEEGSALKITTLCCDICDDASPASFLCSQGGACMDGRNLRMDGGHLLTLKGHIYSHE